MILGYVQTVLPWHNLVWKCVLLYFIPSKLWHDNTNIMDDLCWKDFEVAMGIKICKVIQNYSPWMWLNQSGYIRSCTNSEAAHTINLDGRPKCVQAWCSAMECPTPSWAGDSLSYQHHLISRSFFIPLITFGSASDNPHKILFLCPWMNSHRQAVLDGHGQTQGIGWLEIFRDRKCELG